MPINNPFMPQQSDPEDVVGRTSRWRNFLSTPSGRAALIQFGVSLTQPPSFGDNALSQVGRAVGSAGEAATRSEAAQLAQEEAKSKTEYRGALGEAARARANRSNALAKTGGLTAAQAARLGLSQRSQEALNAQRLFNRKATFEQRYQKYLTDTQSYNALEAAPGQELPVMTREEYARRTGLQPGDVGAPPGPPAAEPTAGPPADYPDARQAPDGNWYVERNGRFFKVEGI